MEMIKPDVVGCGAGMGDEGALAEGHDVTRWPH